MTSKHRPNSTCHFAFQHTLILWSLIFKININAPITFKTILSKSRSISFSLKYKFSNNKKIPKQ